MVSALDVADLAARVARAPVDAARIYRKVGEALSLDRLRAAAVALRPDQHWERLALRRTLEDLFEDQRVIAEAAARAIGDAQAIPAWIEGLGAVAAAPRATLAELETGGPWTFAKTVIAAAEVRGLAARLGAP
jgi:glutamate dehydrogenase